ncbi:MAG: ArnT family glycosyltransferase [Solirubrobacterales bacterium]
MPTAPAAEPNPPQAPGARGRQALTAAVRRPWTAGLIVVLGVALGLRLWGVKHGLPFVYNLDEGAHFVPKAVAYFRGSLDPQYFVNPPAYGYLLHVVFAIVFGREATQQAYAGDPTELFVAARVVTAVLGTGAVAMTWAVGRRLVDERVGVLAAGVLAVGFLPVFYSKHALNDVPTTLPLLLALYGAVGIATSDRRRDWIYAGVGLGLAAATKYTGGIVLVSILAAAAWRLQARPAAAGRRSSVLWLAGVGGLGLLAFAVANPYALIHPGEFWNEGINRQQSASNEVGKLGQSHSSGVTYYLWALTWGIGWGVTALAFVGSGLAARRRPLVALLLIVPVVVFIAFMGIQGRFFGRWLMPVLPLVALLAAYGATAVWDLIAQRTAAAGWRWASAAALGLALFAQGTATSTHNSVVLMRPDTRNVAREWLVDNVPAGSKIVLEPIVSNAWLMDPGRPLPVTNSGERWIKYPVGKTTIDFEGRQIEGARVLNIEDYERILRPALLKAYRARGHCWIVTGSWQYGRAFSEPGVVPRAIDYYRELDRIGTPVFQALPYDRQADAEFNFDWSFDYYPAAYDRPGPEVVIYRIGGPLCDPLPEKAAGPGLQIDRWLARERSAG